MIKQGQPMFSSYTHNDNTTILLAQFTWHHDHDKLLVNFYWENEGNMWMYIFQRIQEEKKNKYFLLISSVHWISQFDHTKRTTWLIEKVSHTVRKLAKFAVWIRPLKTNCEFWVRNFLKSYEQKKPFHWKKRKAFLDRMYFFFRFLTPLRSRKIWEEGTICRWG